ncbi:MAG TPA: pyridoxal-phosphate dependent enzyme [Candidatus Binatia bacterium]|nr:pyridoxal-phosphate dependent enzyme [Candidatus Binatia bacterium]
MSESALALARRLPQLTKPIPRVTLTTLPTPVHRLRRLGELCGSDRLWIKRDDQTCALYGGNKPRKLEFLLGDARRLGRRSVMTFGGIGTNHGLATTVCARSIGLRTILILLPQPVTDHVRHNLLLDYASGAEMRLAANVSGVVAKGLWRYARGWLRRDPPYIIMTGGTSRIGALGLVNAACELAEQVRAGELPEPDAIFVPVGSGGTVAGLMLGLKLASLRSRVVGVVVTDILPPSARSLVQLARKTLVHLRRFARGLPDVSLSEADVTLISGYLGRRYGDPTPQAERAQQLAADLEGIPLETTYTAKCVAAVLDLACREPYRERNLLYWHTYSSVDPGAALDRLPDFHELPPAFHRFFSRR